MIETAEMLSLDAVEDPPNLYGVLTSRGFLTRADTWRHLEQLRRAGRRRWPDLRWAVTVEMQKRGALHLNLLMKGAPDEDAEEVRRVVRDVWCARVDAVPRAQWVDRITQVDGIVRYVADHFLKAEQAPPIGWRGHRFSCSADYFSKPRKAMREAARASLRLRWALYRARDTFGPDAPAAVVDAAAELDLERGEAESWELVRRLGPGWYRPVDRRFDFSTLERTDGHSGA